MTEDIQKERHEDNLASMQRMDRRIDALASRVSSLGGRVDSLGGRVDSVKNDTRHLDECFDRFQVSFASMSENFTTMYNALKIFHSPKEWTRENWIVVVAIIILMSFIPSLPTWITTVLSVVSSTFGIEHHG